MKKSDQLKQERSLKQDAQSAITTKVRAEKREWTPEEEKEFDDLDTEIETLNRSIERELKAEKLEVDRAQRSGRRVGDKGNEDDPDGEGREERSLLKKYSLHRAIQSQLPGKSLDGVELEMHQETVKRAKEAGIDIHGIGVPMSRAAGQTVTQDAGGFGGALVNNDEQPLIDFLRPKPVLESMGATYLTGLQGNLRFPVNNGGITAYWEDEVAETPTSKNAYASKVMSPKRLGAAVPISLQNIMQASIDLERYTISQINQVLANALDLAGLNGSGSGFVPLGILNTPGVNVIANGANGGVPTWANVVDMETQVYIENANAARMGYVINPATKGRLKKAKHEAGDLGYLMDTANTINGYNVGVSNLVPGNLSKGTGSNLSAAIFGDFSQLIIGQWGWLDLTVDNISKKKEGNIEIVTNMFADVLVKQAKAFSIIKDWSNV